MMTNIIVKISRPNGAIILITIIDIEMMLHTHNLTRE